MYRHLLLVFLLSCWGAQAQPAATKPNYPGSKGSLPGGLWNQTTIDFNREFSKLKSVAGRLEKVYGDKNPSAVKALTEITANATFLQGRWNQWVARHSSAYSPTQTPDRYLVSLKRLNQQLALVEAKHSTPEALKRLQDIAADLQIKADNCQHSDDGLGKSVAVKVRTLAGTEEVKGFEIYYVPKGLLDSKSDHERFRRLSSPTDQENLVPGRYAIWSKKDGKLSEPIIQRIGGQGEKNIEIDLPVK